MVRARGKDLRLITLKKTVKDHTYICIPKQHSQSWAQLGPNWGPTGAQPGSNWGPYGMLLGYAYTYIHVC